MPSSASNWRSSTGHDYLKDLDRPGFAWEFLRRNPAYQEDYNTIAREAASDAADEGTRREPLLWRWGLTFPIDPQLAADQATVFWQPEVLPTVVLLAPTPAGLPVAPPIDVARLGPDVAERLDEHCRHLIVRGRDEEFRLCVYTLERDQSLSVVIPFDGGFPVRAAAASRLWARMHASAPGQTPCSLTKQRRDRLILMLRALDGHLAAASYREIAEVLFGATRLEREPWKTSSLRDRTIRLVKGGLALMRDGYRKLLRGA